MTSLLNCVVVPVRWTDQDAYAHLSNAKYFDYMTEARAALINRFTEQGVSCQFVVIKTECQFMAPFFYPDKVTVKQYCQAVFNSSFELTYEFCSETNNGQCHARGYAKIVAFDPKLGRAVRIPDVVRAFFSAQ